MALSTVRLISPTIGDHPHQPSEFKFPKEISVANESKAVVPRFRGVVEAMGLAETGSKPPQKS